LPIVAAGRSFGGSDPLPEHRMSAADSTSHSAGFAFTAGASPVRLLSESDVARHLDPRAVLDALATGFTWLELGEIETPPRPRLSVADAGYSLAMSAWRPGMQMTVKIVNVFDGNHARGLPSHQALITLFDPDTGAPTCIMDGAGITGVRTAAAAMLSVRLLSRPEAGIATIVGAGVQGREHLRLLPFVRQLERINLCARNPERAERLVAGNDGAVVRTDVEAAIRESDIICLTSSAASAVIRPEWVAPGAHVCSVGHQSTGGELPRELAERHRLFVESLDAFRPSPVGCGELAGLDPSLGTTLGAVLLGRKPGRLHADEITVYKAMGNAMEDLVAANLVYRRLIGG
jgi:ornithine cyclodeaminase/alanine dehydrogenase-like protein (mu-crystallin family)